MDHHEDSKQSDASDPDVSDPRKPGDHTTDLSEADKQQARDAYGEPVNQGKFTPCTRRNHFNYNGIDITFEAGTFSAINSMTINPLTGIALPDPLQVPDGYSYVMNPASFFISTALPPLKPLTITIPYTETELKGGEGKWIHDYHGLIPPSLDEETITLVKYVQEPFGQEVEGMSHWEIVKGATLDTQNNTLTFETTETGIFGLTAKALPGELTIDEQIAATVFESGKTPADQAGEPEQRPILYTVVALALLGIAFIIIVLTWIKKRK
jgi:hypothetical protein